MGLISFSFFLPTHNGFPLIKECVQSILNQTYPHFELNILDNFSSDDTCSWLKTVYDPRIRIISANHLLSIEESWARILHIQKQEFMTCVGHDDIFDLHFLEVIKNLIEKYPEAALYQTGAKFINEAGIKIRDFRPVKEHETADKYLEARFKFQRDISGTGYVFRSKDYHQVGGIPKYKGLAFADDALWLLLSKKSYKVFDPAQCVSIRIHSQSESSKFGAWKNTLIGLSQFADFLQYFIKDDYASREVYNNFGPTFFLRYHRNVYIYALIESCNEKKKMDPSIFAKIKISMAKIFPGTEDQLAASFIVKTLIYLNGSFLRLGVNYLWPLYRFAKTRFLYILLTK